MSLTPYIDDGDQRIYHGDCIDVMQQLDADSVSVIITDPPYGLEFMGHKWDAFRRDDPGTNRNRGEYAGAHGELVADGQGRPARVGYGGGKRATTSRCTTCGKRDQYRNAHQPCGPGDWRTEIVDPYSAPPTMLAFQEWCRTWAIEALRVLKPGGHLLAFGGTRTYHRLAAGLEDAGFEIRDCLTWLYGQGYPKSLDVSKAIDKAAGLDPYASDYQPTPDAAAWDGWGTALKPAWEPILLARRPTPASVSETVLEHGTGGLNVKAARIAVDPADPVHDAVWTSRPSNFREGTVGFVTSNSDGEQRPAAPPEGGRWPANLVLAHHPDCEETGTRQVDADGHWPRTRGAGGLSTSGHTGQDELTERNAAGETVTMWNCHADCAVRQLDEQSGNLRARGNTLPTRRDPARSMFGLGGQPGATDPSDAGGASRFFYTAKASTSERNEGLHGLPAKLTHRYGNMGQGPLPQQAPYSGTVERNHHPTVKPLALMRWLVRLATPPGGILLDPFLGSGTTLVAARREGVRGIGIELDPEYLPIAAGRLAQQTLFSIEEAP